VPVRAEVVDLPGLSVHAGARELADWVCGGSQPPRSVFVVHGEPAGSEALRHDLEDRLDGPVVIPAHGERVVAR
jgi:metallo-beta-lactamase family protein